MVTDSNTVLLVAQGGTTLLITEDTVVLVTEDTVILETAYGSVGDSEYSGDWNRLRGCGSVGDRGYHSVRAEHFGVLVAVIAVDDTCGILPCWVTFKIL